MWSCSTKLLCDSFNRGRKQNRKLCGFMYFRVFGHQNEGALLRQGPQALRALEAHEKKSLLILSVYVSHDGLGIQLGISSAS